MSDLPQKWEVVRVFCKHLAQPHDKFCIVIDAAAGCVFFINSDPPPFRKSREAAISIENFEANFLKHTSYVDVMTLEDLDPDWIAEAYKEEGRRHGFLIKTVKTRIINGVAAHGALTDAQRKAIVED